MRWFIHDLKDMPSTNPPTNGMDSVSRNQVFLKQLPIGTYPYCRANKSHTTDSALLMVGNNIWRCIEDNEGCWAWSEDE